MRRGANQIASVSTTLTNGDAGCVPIVGQLKNKVVRKECRGEKKLEPRQNNATPKAQAKASAQEQEN